MLIQDSFIPNRHENPPSKLFPWLIHQASMTDKLMGITGDAQLSLLHQGWTRAGFWEQQVLGLEDESLIHREVLISSNQKPCWYARTIIPKKTFDKHSALFARLKTQSLGCLIFTEPTISRKQHLYYPVHSNSCEYSWLPSSLNLGNNPLWARVAIYSIAEMSYFCLVEILLPTLGELI